MLWLQKKHSDRTISRIVSAYPSALSEEVKNALNVVPSAKLEPTESDIGQVRVADEMLHIPSRVYFPEPDRHALARLSPVQKPLIAALYTRHHDGFVRERWVKELINTSTEWVPPFVIQLIGEYVIEIIWLLSSRREALKHEHYFRFIQGCSELADLTCRRIVSYWECYFRHMTRHFSDHIAYQLAADIGLWRRDIAPRLEKR